MRALDEGIEAELLGARDEIEIVGETFPHVMALRVLPAHDQAQFHSLFSLMTPPTITVTPANAGNSEAVFTDIAGLGIQRSQLGEEQRCRQFWRPGFPRAHTVRRTDRVSG